MIDKCISVDPSTMDLLCELFGLVDDSSEIEKIENSVDREKFTMVLDSVIDGELSERERQVLFYTYGLRGCPIYSLSEIARTLHIARGTASYYLNRALNKFRKAVITNGLSAARTVRC